MKRPNSGDSRIPKGRRRDTSRQWSPGTMESFISLFLLYIIFCCDCPIVSYAVAQALGYCHRPSLVVPEDLRTSRVLTIAHRGASYHVPVEHSLASYQLALELQADYIEVDMVVSSDGILFPMHSVDLNLTTDIATSALGQQRPPWFSTYANRSGYWSFNYTFAELQTLRLIHREGSTPHRTSIYDHLFAIPSLRDVLQLLVDWNTLQLPLLHREKDLNGDTSDAAASHLAPYLERFKSGLYLEFKTTEWIYAETGLDIVSLLFNDILHDLTTDEATDSSSSFGWKDFLSCYERIRFDEYIVPPLILQSFNGTDLSHFHELWHSTIVYGSDTSVGTSNQMSTLAPEPAYILLVDQPACWDDNFWYMVSGNDYRSFLSGIGCNKACLLIPEVEPNNSTDSEGVIEETERLEDARGHLAALMQRVSELQLVLHVWTERPEVPYYVEYSEFQTVMDEIHYLNCNVSHVHGIFSESVDRAVLALQIPCSNGTNVNAKKAQTDGNICSDRSPNARSQWILAGLISFVIGIMVSCCTQRTFRNKRISSYSVQNSDDDNELELSVT
jgi:glycerophosphoryl diester phosphodiesterase